MQWFGSVHVATQIMRRRHGAQGVRRLQVILAEGSLPDRQRFAIAYQRLVEMAAEAAHFGEIEQQHRGGRVRGPKLRCRHLGSLLGVGQGLLVLSNLEQALNLGVALAQRLRLRRSLAAYGKG